MIYGNEKLMIEIFEEGSDIFWDTKKKCNHLQ